MWFAAQNIINQGSAAAPINVKRQLKMPRMGGQATPPP